MKKKKKGMTLIELVIAMTLGLLVLGFVGTFFRVNSEINASTYVKSELQTEAQEIQDRIMSFGMQAKDIDKVILQGGVASNPADDKKNVKYSELSTSGDIPQIKEIIILSLEEDSTGNIKEVKYTLRYSKLDKKLTMQREGASESILSTNVEGFEIKPGDTSKSFSECNSINIDVLLSQRKPQVKKEDTKVNSNMVIVFRNK